MKALNDMCVHLSSAMEMIGFYWKQGEWVSMFGIILWSLLPLTVAVFFIGLLCLGKQILF